MNNADTSKPRYYRAKHSYSPQTSDEVQIIVGDRITDVSDVGNGWVIGHNKTTGTTGLCPRNYLEERFTHRNKVNQIKNCVSTIQLNMTQHNPSTKGDMFIISNGDSSSLKSDVDLLGHNEPGSSTRTLCFRIFVGLVGGIFLGGLLFAVLHLLHQYTIEEAGAISGGIAFIVCLSLIISPHVRCVVALMSVSVFTGQGRVALLSLVPGLLFAGPIMNMQRNVNEGANSVGCVVETVYNETLILNRQLKAFVTRQRENLENAAQHLEEDISNITSNPILQEKNITECFQRLQSMQNECKTIISKTRGTCDTFGTPPVQYHTSNSKRASFAGKCDTQCRLLNPRMLCAHLNNRTCITPRRPTRSISSGGLYLKQRLDQLLGFNITGSRVIDVSSNNSFNPIQNIREVEEEIQKRLDQIINIMRILNRILIIFILLAFINAGVYLRRYLKRIKYDNIYLTSQFKRLNRQVRASDVQKTVLPLQKKEKGKYVDSTSLKLCKAEAFAWKAGMCQVLFYIIITGIFILIDYAVFFLLELVNKNGGADILVSGGSFLEVNIDGIGPVAEFVRQLFSGKNTSSGFQSVLNFEACLPRASEPSQKSIIFIALLYIVILMVVLLQAYGLRIRHKMVAFFFPEREAVRIHYLYRHILLKRRLAAEEEKTLVL